MCIRDWPRYRSVGTSCRVGRNVLFFTKVASVPEHGPRYDASAETCFSCRLARFLKPSIALMPSRLKRLVFTKLRYIRLFLHNLASVPKHVTRQGTSARRCLVIACVFGSGTLSNEAELRRSPLSFTFLRSFTSVPELGLRQATSVQLSDFSFTLGS